MSKQAMAKTSRKREHGPVVPFDEFTARVKAVARGEAPLPDWAGKTVYATESARQHWTQPEFMQNAKLAAFAKLLVDNQDLLDAIRTHNPNSVAELAKTVKRSDSNVSRSLSKLEKFGIVLLKLAQGRAKRPMLVADRVIFEVNVVAGRVAISRHTSTEAS
jgi:predicted transcriptional regulator